MKICETCGQRWLVIHRCDDSETAKQDQEMQRLQIVTPDRTECEHGGLKRKCRTCELEAELRQWNTEFPGGLGQAQQAKHMAIAAVKAIGAVYEETSPTDIADAVTARDAKIERLKSDIAHAVNEGKKYRPDYPWTQNNASEVAWALGQSCMGIRAANDDCHKEIKRLRAKLVDAHRHCCTPENCVLDGGPEHAAAFPTKGETDVS